MNWYTILLFILYNAYFVKSLAESLINIICQLMRCAVQSGAHCTMFSIISDSF